MGMSSSSYSKKLFGKTVSNKRKSLKLTLQQVATMCGVSTNFVSLIERGLKLPSENVIVKLSKALEIDENELFRLAGKLHPQVIQAIQDHVGLRELFFEVTKTVKDESQRQELFEEVYNVYLDFLKRHNIR